MTQQIARLTSVGLVAAAALFAAACGGGGSSTANNPQTTATVMTEAQKEQKALPLAQAAPVPKDLHCKGPIVWVNMHTKAYHEAGDPYYGRTKNGQYMCKAAADADGYHMAGERHKGGGMESGGTQGGCTSAGGTMTSTRHHRRKGETPNPKAT